ncbi:anti-sigma factor [Nocardioides sp. SYSU D00065]|uniref:anti-sigma factor n=1 Tax=Nocardioides sp. SYSU D00065 TaxID=2817378 RepID=UPI001B3288E3|nr:anti-sigma factor [Nocardioides sp. SYSU D00065]
MKHVDDEDLAGFALDPADASPEVRRHVESCADCAETLAALSDVRRLTGAEPMVPAADRVRAAVLAEVRRPDGPNDVTSATTPAGTPGLAAAADTVRLAPRAPLRAAARIPAWAAGIAAAVALAAGLGLGQLTAGDPTPEESDPGTVVAAADLTALDSDAPRGVARVVRSGETVTLRVSAEQLGGEDGFHEVWLINVDGTRMVALGVLAAGDEGQFQVPRGLIDDGYRIVDISVEPEDGDPTHSGVSLARGELA